MNIRHTTRSPQRPRPETTARRFRAAAATGALAVGLAGSILGASALADVDQARAVNPNEHLGHADNAAMHHVQDERRARGACSDRLVQAWLELGHFSDAYETHLLGQPPCD